MEANISKKSVSIICLILVLCITSLGYATKTQDLFKEYLENRPDASSSKVGDVQADKTLYSIADQYGITIDTFDKYLARLENSKVALIGEEIRKEKGDEAYKEYVQSLEGEDKKQYDAYLQNETNKLAVVGGYLKNALILQDGVRKLDPKKLVSNPFKAASAAVGVNKGRKQSEYSVKTLTWLDKTNKIYKEAQQYQGK